MTNSPEGEEVVVLTNPIWPPWTVMVALGTTAPLTSFTDPKIVPEVTCASRHVLLTQIAKEMRERERVILRMARMTDLDRESWSRQLDRVGGHSNYIPSVQWLSTFGFQDYGTSSSLALVIDTKKGNPSCDFAPSRFAVTSVRCNSSPERQARPMKNTLHAGFQVRIEPREPASIKPDSKMNPRSELSAVQALTGGSPKPAGGVVDASRFCPNCSSQLVDQQCKLKCPNCGYYLSCSDFY